MKEKKAAPPGYRERVERSALPIYVFGAVVLLYAVCFPFYKFGHYVAAAAVAGAVAGITAIFAPKKVTYVQEKPVPTGNSDADALLLKGREMLFEVRKADENIQNAAVSGKIKDIEDVCGKIFSYVEKNAEKGKKLRRFMDYYLPTTLKLLNEYSELEKQGVSGENIDGTKQNIENALGTVKEAFEKQLDALFSDTALDVSTDITVMQSLLASQGLLEDKEEKK
ncbi:MAG: 5-bromo-4-chloroindolyl phosphate hydrolysis family protein [Clostridia bacterium]|nr:5-bromo-4-chloroindolyl phosphate hydrolysis family protein [Clostridia bacterium]